MVVQDKIADNKVQQLAEANRNKKNADKDKLVKNKLKIAKRIEKAQIKKADLERLNQTGQLGFFGKLKLHRISRKLEKMQENSVKLEQAIRSRI